MSGLLAGLGGMALGAVLFGAPVVISILALPTERIKPERRVACDALFADYIAAADIVALQRAQASLRALDCDFRRRLINRSKADAR
jgi:hypothetical protein